MTNYRKAQRLEKQLDQAFTNHTLHLLLSIVTAGVWVVMWMAIGISNTMSQRRINKALDKVYER